MSCDLITSGRDAVCKDSVGGLRNIYFVNASDLPESAVTYDVTNTDLIASVTGTPSAYKYELNKDTANSVEAAITSSDENGTTFFDIACSFAFPKINVTTHKQIKLLAYGIVKIIVQDNNNNFFLVGLERGATTTGGTIVTGSALADMSGYTLTMNAKERTPFNLIDVTDEAGLTTAGFTVVAA